VRDEGTFGLGHTIDGSQQFPPDSNECHFGVLAPCTELLIVGPEPGIKTGRDQRRHPERGSEARMAEGNQRRMDGPMCAGLLEAWDEAHRGGQRGGTAECAGVAQFRDQARRGLGAYAVDGRQQRANVMVAQLALNVPLELLDPLPEDLQILAGIAHWDLIGRGLVLAHRLPSRLQERLRELRPDEMAPIIPQRGQASA